MPYLPNRRARRAWFAYRDAKATHFGAAEWTPRVIGNQHNGSFIRLVALPSFRTSDRWHLRVENAKASEWLSRLPRTKLDELEAMKKEVIEIVAAHNARKASPDQHIVDRLA